MQHMKILICTRVKPEEQYGPRLVGEILLRNTASGCDLRTKELGKKEQAFQLFQLFQFQLGQRTSKPLSKDFITNWYIDSYVSMTEVGYLQFLIGTTGTGTLFQSMFHLKG